MFASVLLLTAACSGASVPPVAHKRPDHAPVVRRVVEPVLAEVPHRAVGVVVVEGGRSSVFAFGPRNASAPFDADTSFEIGSVSKTFVGMLLAGAVRRSEVALEDPVARHLPPGMELAHGDVITLRDLATHAAGFPLMPSNWTGLDPETRRTTYTHERFREYLAAFEPLHAPRAGYSYSNVDIAVLGAVLSHRANTSFRDLLERRLLHPLGMRASDYRDRPLATDNVLDGYDEHGKLRPKRVDTSPLGPCCAISTTLGDMARFLEAAVDPRHPYAADFRLATKTHYSNGEAARKGLGWDVEERLALVRKNGQVAGYRSEIVLDPRNRRGLFVVVNSEAVDIDTFAFDLVHALFAPIPAGARERYRASVVKALPPGAPRADARFEDAIELAAWRAPATARPGDRIEVELFWRCLRRVENDWQVFVHVDSEGDGKRAPRIRGDHFPASSSTLLWEPGTVIRDAFALEIPDSQPAGSYTLFVGLYRSATRMLATQDATPTSDNRVRGPVIAVVRPE